MTIKILIAGANGKMGLETQKAIKESSQFEYASGINRNDDLSEAIKLHKPKIVIDLTNADAVFKNTQIIIENNVHPVIGSSGLTKDQIELLSSKCSAKKLGAIIAPNFSIGAILMMQFAKQAAKYFNDAEIIEMHHQGKLDSPSGTAIKTAELINENIKNSEKSDQNYKEVLKHSRGANLENIAIHSLRMPGCIANQDVIFGGPGETLTISHKTIDRKCFMAGVLLACRKVIKLESMIYGLENII